MIHYLLYGVFAFIIFLTVYMIYLAFFGEKPTIVASTTNMNPSMNPYLPNNENPINTSNQIPINNQVYNSNSNNTLGFNNK